MDKNLYYKDIQQKYNTLNIFFEQIKNIPILSVEEQQTLAIDYYENNSLVAAEKLVLHNQMLVYNLVITKYIKYKYMAMDLINEGIIGLMIAVKKFNPFKKVKFTTYAYNWVRAKINKYLENNSTIIKRFYCGGSVKQINGKRFYTGVSTANKVYKAIEKGMSREEILNNINVSEDNLEIYLSRFYQKELPITTWNDGEEELNTIDLDRNIDLANTKTPESDLYNKIDSSIKSKIIAGVLQKFNERELFIIQHRLIEEDMTQQEIGNIYSISRERVRQIEENIKNRLKTLLNKKHSKELYE